MLKDLMESQLSVFKMSFGKFNGQVVSEVGIDWALWWLHKRERDETEGVCDLDPEHKMAAEKKHNFNRTYLFLIYHVFKHTHIQRPGKGAYEVMATKFWSAINQNTEFDTGRRRCRDEIDSFFYTVWSEEPSF